MKQSSTLAVSVGLFLLALGGTVQSAQEKGTLEERVQDLEFQLKANRDVVDSLLAEVKDLQAHKASVETYLTAQALQAEAMAATLDESEREGFTQGINFKSREVLLAGWRDQLSELRANVPGMEKPRGDSKESRRATR